MDSRKSFSVKNLYKERIKLAIKKYRPTPNISTIVVMNGAETSAGSTLKNRNIKGNDAPVSVDITDIPINVMLTTAATSRLRPSEYAQTTTSVANTNPSIKTMVASLKMIEIARRGETSPVASPLITTVAD